MTYNPSPKSGYIPVVLTNDSGVADSDVYVTFVGKYQDPTSDEFFFQLSDLTNPPMGVYAPVPPTDTTLSSTYSYLLTSLPSSSTGVHDYLVYVPSAPSNRFYFSIKSGLYLQADATPANNIAAPTYYAFYDPNYNNLFESVEMSFFPEGGSGGANIPWTSSFNTTAVDALCIPMRIQYQSYNPASPTSVTSLVQNPNALPSGFGVGGASGATTRSGILTKVLTTLTNGDLTNQTPKIWPKLAIPFYSDPYSPSGLVTYLRVLSPKQSIGNSSAPINTGGLTNQHLPTVQPGPTQFFNYNYPPFPLDYLQSGSYGNTNTFSDNLFSHYTGSIKLYMSTGGGSPTIYEAATSGTTPNQVLTFTGISGTHTGNVVTFNQSDMNTFDMYSGNQLFNGTSDQDLLGFYFGDAFVAGLLGGSVGTVNGTVPPNIPINITDAVTWEPYYIPLYYTAQYAFSGGPWYDLYSQALHAVAVRNSVTGSLNGVGLCYSYDFDDSLGISGTITPSSLTALDLNPYASITIGSIDTSIPDPYSDSNSYSVTFNYPNAVGYSLQYAQGGGSYITITNGQTVTGLVSNRTTPLKLHYTNTQGPTGDHYFEVYLYYQFLVPLDAYNASTTGIINATTITPNSSTPTAFTINLLP